MKICPKCQQQYPNGFQYCPSDTEVLLTNEEYVRRTKPLSATPVAEHKTPTAEPRTPSADRRTPTVERKAPFPERAENPSVEVVPLKNQVPDETAVRPRKPAVPPTPANPTPTAHGQVTRDSAVPLPFRKPEPQPPHSTEEAPRRAHSEEVPRRPHPEEAPRRPYSEEAPRRPYSEEAPRRPYPEEAPRRPQLVAEEPPRRPQPAPPANRPAAVPAPRPAAPPARTTAATPSVQSFQTPTFQSPRSPQNTTPPSLNFSVPDQGGLVSRLIGGFKNIGDVFKTAPATRGGAPGDFRFLLPDEPFIKRMAREVAVAMSEFRRNPMQFIKGEGVNRYRRNALLAGSEMAFVGLVTIYFISMAIGGATKVSSNTFKLYFIGFAIYLAACYLTRGLLLYKLISRATAKFGVPKLALEFANWVPVMAFLVLPFFLSNYNLFCVIFPDRCIPPEEIQTPEKLIALQEIIPVTKPEIKLDESPKAKTKQIGGSKPKPKPASGGGGGGRQQPTPPSKGVPPVMALVQPIKPPDPEPPKIKNPSLVVAQNIYGDPKALPVMKGPIGDPTGVPAPPSSGPGKGDGIGRGTGQGVGGGDGGGLGNGRGGNTGGGDMGLGGGASVQPMSASLKPTILYKEKAKYTEEARQNKIQGTVVLNVVFKADGTIDQVRVVRGLPDGLTEKAIEAARKIRFQPAVKAGAPVSVRGNLEFTFNLY